MLLIVLIYLARSALMNSVYALEESIMMDFVPKNTRATWKGLESISVFGWCGSAALGGVIADATDYPTTFLITAAVQGTGALMFALLYFIIPRDQDREKHPAEAGGAADAADASAAAALIVSDGLEPLVMGAASRGAAAGAGRGRAGAPTQSAIGGRCACDVEQGRAGPADERAEGDCHRLPSPLRLAGCRGVAVGVFRPLPSEDAHRIYLCDSSCAD